TNIDTEYYLFLVTIKVDFFFFFFQAEDGIRDFHVTGVQTCALPIYKDFVLNVEENECGTFATLKIRANLGINKILDHNVFEIERSEERRVGKECRSRWSRYHEKKER